MLSTKASDSTAHRSAVSRRSRKATCWSSRIRRRPSSTPFPPATPLVLTCNIRDPMTGQSYSRDPRYIAQKAETYLKGTGRADTSYFGPEAEFFVFNDVRYGQGINYAFHENDSSEGRC